MSAADLVRGHFTPATICCCLLLNCASTTRNNVTDAEGGAAGQSVTADDTTETGGMTGNTAVPSSSGGDGGSAQSASNGGGAGDAGMESGGESGAGDGGSGDMSAVGGTGMGGGTQTTQGGGTGGVLGGGGGSGGETDGVGGASAGGTGGSEPPAFRGGPCAVSPDEATLELFARGVDSQIYRAVVPDSGKPAWTVIDDLDGSLIDNRSDLDCSGTTAVIHIVALGKSPAGAYLHATGTGTTYNAFTRDLEEYTFGYSPTIFHSGSTLLAATEEGGNALVFSRADEITDLKYRSGMQFASGSDVWWQTYVMSDTRFVAGYDRDGMLALHMLKRNIGGETWSGPILFPPPASFTYEYSPTVCGWHVGSPPSQATHVIAVAGGKLWYSYSTGELTTYSAWEKMTDTTVTSAPDCALTSGSVDGVVHVVALSETGSVVEVRGTAGAFVATDLGVYP